MSDFRTWRWVAAWREIGDHVVRRPAMLRERGLAAHDVDAICGGALADTTALRAVRDWLAARQWVIVLLGPPGVGKTLAASWAVAQREYGAELVAVGDMARWRRFDEPRWGQIEERDLLVLDDLGVEVLDAGGWMLATIDALIAARYRAGLKTLITSNLTAEQFRSRYGERVADRIRERGRVVSCAGASLRGRR